MRFTTLPERRYPFEAPALQRNKYQAIVSSQGRQRLLKHSAVAVAFDPLTPAVDKNHTACELIHEWLGSRVLEKFTTDQSFDARDTGQGSDYL